MGACPLEPPVWASILDDVWCLFTDEEDEANLAAAAWMPRVDAAWSEVGVITHPKKKVDRGAGVEVRGARVGCEDHRVGLSGAKTADAMIAGWRLCCQFSPGRRAVERMLGKYGHARQFRTPLRASLGSIYGRIHELREARAGRAPWEWGTWWQFMETRRQQWRSGIFSMARETPQPAQPEILEPS